MKRIVLAAVAALSMLAALASNPDSAEAADAIVAITIDGKVISQRTLSQEDSDQVINFIIEKHSRPVSDNPGCNTLLGSQNGFMPGVDVPCRPRFHAPTADESLAAGGNEVIDKLIKEADFYWRQRAANEAMANRKPISAR